MSADFDSFVREVIHADLAKVGQAASFLWWAEKKEGKQSLSTQDICGYFVKARLPKPNSTRLESDLRRSEYVNRVRASEYCLSHFGLEEGTRLFSAFVVEVTPDSLVPDIDLTKCPHLTDGDLVDAKKMAELYVTLFALENSVRRHIESVLEKSFGAEWWEKTASASMKRKEQDRRANETQNKWIPSRSSSGPLYSLDWPDLVTLMRKHEDLFRKSIADVNFLHRFSDLSNLRNVVAHNGVIDEPMQFKRVELAIHDWIKQVGSSIQSA